MPGAERALAAFTDWFSSSACTWQTAIIVVAIGAIEIAHPSLDMHGFWLLWALTLFSAITQPALAHSGAVQAEHLEKLLARLERLERRAVQREVALEARLDRIEDMLERKPDGG